MNRAVQLLLTVMLLISVQASADSGVGGLSFRNLANRPMMMYWVASPGNYKRQARVSLLLADEFDICWRMSDRSASAALLLCIVYCQSLTPTRVTEVSLLAVQIEAGGQTGFQTYAGHQFIWAELGTGQLQSVLRF